MITIDAPPGELNVRILSSILNLVCPQCGGSMSEYQCEGRWGRNWLPEWGWANRRRKALCASKRHPIRYRDLTGAFRVLPFGTQAYPQGSGHGRHSIYRSESGKPTAVNGVFALTFTVSPALDRAENTLIHASQIAVRRCTRIYTFRYTA